MEVRHEESSKAEIDERKKHTAARLGFAETGPAASREVGTRNAQAQPDSDIFTKNGLRFSQRPDGQYVCHDLDLVRQEFNKRHTEQILGDLVEQCSYAYRLKDKPVEKTEEETQKQTEAKAKVPGFEGFMKELHDMMVGLAKMDEPLEKTADGLSVEERAKIGREMFKKVAASLPLEGMDLFDKFLFLSSDWWYYHPLLSSELKCDMAKIGDVQTRSLTEKLLPCLPEPVQQSLSGFEFISAAVCNGHFGLYFCDNRGTRRIVTDTQLIELHNVGGYRYFDMSEDGRAFVRCRTNQDGGRAFFDGTRLMSHQSFQTCAPKTVFFSGGYKVNSTECTIVNGMLYPLLDIDDKVAKTTGAWNIMGMRWVCDFTTQQALDSYAMSEASAKSLAIGPEGEITLNDAVTRPVGVFAPSEAALRHDGFSLYSWSEFKKM